MDDLVASLGINNPSKSQVSVITKDLDLMVEDFRTRPLGTGPYLYVSCDALTMKVREGGRVLRPPCYLPPELISKATENYWACRSLPQNQ